MKKILPMILGVALLAAAPLSAQSDSSAHATALLKEAQAAAAAGRAQEAAELAQAAAQLLSARQPHAEAHVVESVIEGVEIHERLGAQLQQLGYVDVEQADTAPAREQRRPRRRVVEGFEMPPQGSGPAAPQDDVGMTLRIIHAEVQALRAEVQAMRAEMALMRSQGGGNARGGMRAGGPLGNFYFPGPASEEHFEMRAPSGEWRSDAPDVRRRVIIIGPDGKMQTEGSFDDEGMEWTDDDGNFEVDGFEIQMEEDDGDGPHSDDHVRGRTRWFNGEPQAPSDSRARLNFQFHEGPRAAPPQPSAPPRPRR